MISNVNYLTHHYVMCQMTHHALTGDVAGDTRLGSMETGTALTRAAVAVVQHRAHLINMSFGEPTAVANQVLFIQFYL